MIVEVFAKALNNCKICDPDAPIWNTGTGLVVPLRLLNFNECILIADGVITPSPFNKLWNPETLLYEVKKRGWFPLQVALTDGGVTLFTKEVIRDQKE